MWVTGVVWSLGEGEGSRSCGGEEWEVGSLEAVPMSGDDATWETAGTFVGSAFVGEDGGCCSIFSSPGLEEGDGGSCSGWDCV